MKKLNLEKVEIKNLLDNFEFEKDVSFWIWSEWHKTDEISLEDIRFRTRHSQGRTDIPQTFIALFENEIVGTFSLWNNEKVYTQDLRPWFSCLYVKEEYRNQGLARHLQNFATQKTKELGYDTLYLITEYDNFYEKFGWEYIETAPIGQNQYFRIYKKQIK